MNRNDIAKSKKYVPYGLILICMMITMLIITHNERLYHRTLARVIYVQDEHNASIRSANQLIYQQRLRALILNGSNEGKTVELENQYTQSKAYDNRYHKGDELFLSLSASANGELSGTITGVKRDQYLVIAAGIFFLLLILVGKKKGFFSALSLMVNVIVLYYALDLYRHGMNLILLSCMLAIAFTLISMLLVLGKHRKAYSAIISTVLATCVTMLITFTVLLLTKENGMRYEEMQFITRPIYPIFMSEVLLGSLGAIMDVAITISSSVYELCDNNEISKKALINSSQEIGRDIMGTMCNVLLLAYVTGTIPMIILYMRNGMPVFNAFYSNLSLELVRALTGSIGIVLAIPISIYVSIYFLHHKGKGGSCT